jgi:hypothetical protein
VHASVMVESMSNNVGGWSGYLGEQRQAVGFLSRNLGKCFSPMSEVPPQRESVTPRNSEVSLSKRLSRTSQEERLERLILRSRAPRRVQRNISYCHFRNR